MFCHSSFIKTILPEFLTVCKNIRKQLTTEELRTRQVCQMSASLTVYRLIVSYYLETYPQDPFVLTQSNMSGNADENACYTKNTLKYAQVIYDDGNDTAIKNERTIEQETMQESDVIVSYFDTLNLASALYISTGGLHTKKIGLNDYLEYLMKFVEYIEPFGTILCDKPYRKLLSCRARADEFVDMICLKDRDVNLWTDYNKFVNLVEISVIEAMIVNSGICIDRMKFVKEYIVKNEQLLLLILFMHQIANSY